MNSRATTIEALRTIREQRLQRMLALCETAHPFYRRRFADLGLAARDIRSLDDLERLPLTTKTDYMAAPEHFRLEPHALEGRPLEETTLWNVAYTTGTTSRPTPFFNTTHDQYSIMLQAKRCAEVEGLRREGRGGAGDVLGNLVPLPPMPTGGFLVVGRTAEAIGIPVVFGLTGAHNAGLPIHRGLDEAIDVMSAANVTAIWGIPSFLRRFLRRARERDAPFPRLRMLITTGEPVSDAMSTEYIEHLRAFGASDPQVRVRYSFTEMQGGLVQCCNGAQVQNVMPELYLLEVVDPATGKRRADGEDGALALTHLDRRGTVQLRYLVGDMVSMRLEACPHCGVLGERLIEKPRRTDDLVKVKGLLINPALVMEALSADKGVREYQLVVRKADANDPDSPDVLEVRIEADAGEHARLAASLPDLVQKAVLVRPQVRFMATGAIFDPQRNIKARRFIDERKR